MPNFTTHRQKRAMEGRGMPKTLELTGLKKTFRASGRDGKSTTLRSIAGLESPDAGTIRLGDQVVFDSARKVDLTPERRDIGMVFQSFALWPHMTVEQIVRFPLTARRVDRATAERRVRSALELVNCEDLSRRHPGELSGGQQQRIALARALVAEPSVLLFDEPLSNLDAGLRADLRSEIDRVHQTAGFTGVYVTHDQVEALAVADRIAVMNAGSLVQIGTAIEVYRRPYSEWVAGFMGFTNRIVRASQTAAAANGPADGPNAAFRFRPESIRTASTGRDGELAVDGTVIQASFVGHAIEYKVDVDGDIVDARVPTNWSDGSPETLAPGAPLRLYVPSEDLLAYDIAGGSANPVEALA